MKTKLCIVIMVLSMFLIPVNGDASNSKTMKNLEQELTSYLNDPSLIPGTEEYQTFVINQLMFEQDQELTRKENYSDLIVYMSGYINNRVLQENEFYEQTPEELEEKQQNNERATQATRTRLPSFVNPTDVKTYARRWWNDRNPEFPDFSDDGGNCSNYASQLLLAGGINRVTPNPIPNDHINMDPNYWYSYKNSNSPSTYSSSLAWVNVEAFYNFWKESQELIQPSNLNAHRDLEVGDVIQLQHTTGGSYYHAMVVIDKDASTVYLTGNTNDRERMDIRDIKGNNIRAIKFTRPSFDQTLPTLSYQIIRPHLNRNLAVSANYLGARLTDNSANNIRAHTMFYVPEKKAYSITTIMGTYPFVWTGGFGVGNLRLDTDFPWDPENAKADHDLWILEPVQNGLFIIRSWVDPSMVWDVHNYTPNVSTPVKLEKLHPVGAIERNAQMFFLERF